MHDKAGLFGRFGAAWTPTILVMTPRAFEIRRIEGYLPPQIFLAELEMGLARSEFFGKQFESAEKQFDHIAREHASHKPEAMYWRAVAKYSGTHEPAHLGQVAKELTEQFPDSIWSARASVWGG